MIYAEGIRMLGSKEANMFRRFYRIPFVVGISPYGGDRRLVYYYCLFKMLEHRLLLCTGSAFAADHMSLILCVAAFAGFIWDDNGKSGYFPRDIPKDHTQ